MLFRVKNPLFTTNFVTVKFVTRSAGAFVDTTTSIRLGNVGRSVCLDRVVYSLHSQEVVAKPLLQSAPPRGGTRDDFSKVAHYYFMQGLHCKKDLCLLILLVLFFFFFNAPWKLQVFSLV